MLHWLSSKISADILPNICSLSVARRLLIPYRDWSSWVQLWPTLLIFKRKNEPSHDGSEQQIRVAETLGLVCLTLVYFLTTSVLGFQGIGFSPKTLKTTSSPKLVCEVFLNFN